MEINEGLTRTYEVRMLPWRGSKLALRSYGEGPHVTLCIHGFLEDSQSFAALAEALPGHRLLALDMPFHGQTEWNDSDRLKPIELVEVLMQCPELEHGQFGILGYSMGGKIALSLYEQIPDRISQLILVAPDGLRPDPWHTFFTRTRLGDIILQYTMTDPRWFRALLKVLSKAGIVNEGLYRFTLSYLGDEGVRKKVYKIWRVLRDFRPDRAALPALLRQHQPKVRMFFGRYDRICPVRIGEGFLIQTKGQAQIDILEAGHLLLREKHTLMIAAAFPPLPSN